MLRVLFINRNFIQKYPVRVVFLYSWYAGHWLRGNISTELLCNPVQVIISMDVISLNCHFYIKFPWMIHVETHFHEWFTLLCKYDSVYLRWDSFDYSSYGLTFLRCKFSSSYVLIVRRGYLSPLPFSNNRPRSLIPPL